MLCVECNRVSENHGRGLCAACHLWMTNHDRLDEFPRAKRKSWEVAEDYLFIKAQDGGTLQNIADRIGMSKNALCQALKRQGVKA